MGAFSDITTRQAPAASTQGSGFKLEDLLPMAGGAIGGIGGAFLGPLGSIGGGAAGSALGQWLENKLTGTGNIGDVIKQGLYGGAAGVGGELLGAGAKALGIGGKAVLESGAEASGKLATTGESMLKQVLGTAKGVGASPMGSAVEGDLLKTAQQYGIKKYSDLPKVYDALNKAVGTQLEGSTASIPAKTLITDLQSGMKDGFINIDQKSLSNELLKIHNMADKAGNISAQDLFAYKNSLNSRLGNAFKAAEKGTLTAPQETGLAVWDATHGALGKLEPTVNALTKEQSNLYKLAPGLKGAEGKGGIGIKGLTIPGSAEASQFAKTKVANALVRAGTPISTGGRMAAQGTAQLLRGLGTGSTPTTPTSAATTDSGVQSLLSGGSGAGSSPSANGPSLDNQTIAKLMIADLASTGGKNLTAIEAIGKLLAPPTAGSDGNLTTAQLAKRDAINTALSSLDAAQNNLIGAGGAKGIAGNAALIPYFGQFIDKPGAAYHDTKIELATQIAKAITGGSRPASTVIESYMHSLPDVNNDPTYAQDKLDKIRSELLILAKNSGFNSLVQQYGGQ